MSSLRLLTTAPKSDDFTPLQEHQQQTPSTFFGAKPVLYVHQTGLNISASKAKLQSDDAFAKFSSEPEGASEDDVLVRDVEAWVNSENLILFQKAPNPTGVSIPYPSIALHGITKKNGVEALLMNLSLNDAETVNADEDIDVLEIILLPHSHHADTSQTSPVQEIFAAMNTCADLHPDPEDGEEAAPDLSEPGATGWITADNMDEFVDEDGNFKGGMVIGGEELGPGAGTVRPREGDEEESATNGVNGHEEKYQRTG
ncbi:uncharacterized protein CC84DRAFT_1092976 [Paraphaeosphaeria sporulosa]|uniref:Protein LOT5 n=1 Tax=Paraphaeosphaeria sporulosa TaxID=1460663 RepID=A0A177CDB9_9PLEO|nr:uncharacterized protein CC84DRAFT_1092976 [Paraphaeosphaeria sporulosa]OAG04777.1 hypothetical protein CC84DRAFT_1092976 [Paraphaeosphaeria sporulosa]